MAQQWQKDLPEAQGSKLNPTSNERTLWRSSSFTHDGLRYTVRFKARWDDTCRNGSNSFYCRPEVALGDTDRMTERCYMSDVPEDILATIPKELLALEKWNGCHPFGPWYYIENTVYLAGDRDHFGMLPGEKQHVLRGGRPGAKRPPQTYRMAYVPVCRIGTGKPRELDAARSVAIWPDATDEELSVPKEELIEKLKARLPALLVEFRQAIESVGFRW